MIPCPPVMLITDATQAVLPLHDLLHQSLIAGCRWIVLRDLTADDETLTAQALSIKKLCAPFGATFCISRNVSVAKTVRADGLHLSASQHVSQTKRLCPTMLIGQSCHSLQDILNAEKNGVDYVTLSPIFETASKPGYAPLGLHTLEDACKQTPIPIIALGGLDNGQVKPCQKVGANGIAVMGHIMRSKTPLQTMKNILLSGQFRLP